MRGQRRRAEHWAEKRRALQARHGRYRGLPPQVPFWPLLLPFHFQLALQTFCGTRQCDA